MITVPFFVQKH